MTHQDPNIPRGAVVVGVDGSEHADRALAWAADQAARENRPLVALAVAHHPPDFGGVAGVMYLETDLVAAMKTVADDAAGAARARHPGLQATAHAVAGDPRTALVDASETASSVVVGSRGRGVFRSLVLGSVSVGVAQHAHCPVVVTRPTHTGGVRNGVVVGADGTPESVTVLEHAFEQASFLDLPLTVMHCFWDATAGVVVSRDHDQEADLEARRAVVSESLAGLRERFPDVHVTTVLTEGLVDECLAPTGRQWDLVVVGHHPRGGRRSFLSGSTAAAVLERATSPVVVVPVEET